jgi:serine-type D-Ala-D-Ala carboxypeptidase/endopeptidase (penicillin-binding protein 4)
MLDLIAWLNINISGQSIKNLEPLELFSWQETAIFALPHSDRNSHQIAQNYLLSLASQGINPIEQGIWVQSDWTELANHQGTVPIPAASLTKIATTLTALGHWGADHRFTTKIYATGRIKDGVVEGDLVIEGSGDPLFVWEEAIALGNALNQLGIRQVQGDLLVTDKFYMNYQDDAQVAGTLLKQGLDQTLWQEEVTQQYLQLTPGTLKPQVAIAGEIKLSTQIPPASKLLLRHQSLPLTEILKQMNIYSNNEMAQMLADLAGGAREVERYASKTAHFPQAEIQLINGSGLGEENRISPRAICQMLIAIDSLLAKHSLSATELFPTVGRDLVGTVKERKIPLGTTVKTGTLDSVSSLGGIIPTSDRGKVYFAIINYGSQVEYFRQQQDQFLNGLVQNWKLRADNFQISQQMNWYLGDPNRNLKDN